MESTRQTILGILRRRHSTVEEIRTELSLAPATVRRHLDILARDGHVEVAQVRRRTGRPHYVFSLSEAGEELFPKHYVRITNRLIEEIISLTEDETAGKGGGELADLVFDKMAHRLAQSIGPRVHGSTLEERVDATAQGLAEEGIAFDVEKTEDGYLLVGHGCPCPRVGDRQHQVCAHDQRLLSQLLAADVTYVDPGSVGQTGYCAYRVQERRPGNMPSGQAKENLPSAGSQV